MSIFARSPSGKLSPSALDKAAIAYARGANLREAGELVGVSHEWVRQAFHDAGIPIRPHGVTLKGRAYAPELSDLAVEVFSDLEDEFAGRASIDQLASWIGNPPHEIETAALELRACGWAMLNDGVLAIAPNPRAVEFKPRRPDLTERNNRIAGMLASGSTYDEIAAALGVTKSTVAGVAWRRRKGGGK